MTRRGRENLFVFVAAASIGAWLLARRRGGVGAVRVGQDLASYFRRGGGGIGRGFGFGLPSIRIEVPSWRQTYYPTMSSPYVPTTPYPPASPYLPPAQRQAPVTYWPSPMPVAPVQRPKAPLPLPAGPRAATRRPNFAERLRVSEAQHALNALYGNLLEEDGTMGPQTSDVLQMFQKQHGLPETGVVDDPTRAALETASRDGAATAERGWWDWERPGQEV